MRRATGARNQQTGRAGEYFVAAERSRRGAYAVTFAGSMPRIDILVDPAEHLSGTPRVSRAPRWRPSRQPFLEAPRHHCEPDSPVEGSVGSAGVVLSSDKEADDVRWSI